MQKGVENSLTGTKCQPEEGETALSFCITCSTQLRGCKYGSAFLFLLHMCVQTENLLDPGFLANESGGLLRRSASSMSCVLRPMGSISAASYRVCLTALKITSDKTTILLAACISILFFPLERLLTFNVNLLHCDLNLLPLDLSTTVQALLPMGGKIGSAFLVKCFLFDSWSFCPSSDLWYLYCKILDTVP